jgi:ATP-dependent phosphofructokinase / diphosphate-dependent phosphofructokinase
MPEVERDEHGNVRLGELELDRLLARQVKDRFRKRGKKVTVEGKNIGYELRCVPPSRTTSSTPATSATVPSTT